MTQALEASGERNAEVVKYEGEGKTWLQQAQALQIVDQEGAERVGDMLKSIKALVGEIEASQNPGIEKAHALHKHLVAERNRLLSPLLSAREVLNQKFGSFQLAARRKREAEEQMARAVQREQEERARKEAEALEAQGEPELAEVVRQEAAAEPPPFVAAPPPPKVSGVAVGETWYAEVTSKQDLVLAVAEGKAQLECVEPAMPVLNKLAAALKGALRIPGVVAKSRPRVSTR